jgi:ankyrin repeat protein
MGGLVESGSDDQGAVAAFINAAVSDLRRAKEILAAHPAVAGAGFYAALVLGDETQVKLALETAPDMATRKGGPQDSEPLLYVCFSRFASRASHRAERMAETARILLRYGADPNVALTPPELPDNPLSCLYAATGLNNNPSLGLVLLEAGANPNDNESLYHSTEHRDRECLKLLLSHGANPKGTNTLKHMLDVEDPEGLQLLLEAGADPREKNEQGESALHLAVWRRRSPQTIAVLIDAGAEIDAERSDGRTAYALAVQTGQDAVAQFLEAHGAKNSISPLDHFLSECSAADAKELDHLLANLPSVPISPGSERLVPDLAMNRRVAAVRALLALGMPVDTRGELGATALHWACWKGYADVAEILLRHGASLTIEDQQFHGTPPGWFGHGARNCHEGGGDYPGVARLLLGAGATIPSVDLATGKPDVDAVLREHGVI